MICSACESESFSKKDRRKGSSCEDCFMDNQIVEQEYSKDPCDCHAVGHDKSKLKEIEPIEESLYDNMKKSSAREKNKINITLYKIKELRKLKDETSSKPEREVYLKELKKLGEIKILEDDE